MLAENEDDETDVEGINLNEISIPLEVQVDDELDEYGVFSNSCVRVHCVAHRFQLGVCAFMFKDSEITAILNKVAKLSAKLRTPLVRRLADDGTVKLKMPTMSQATRWSSNIS